MGKIKLKKDETFNPEKMILCLERKIARSVNIGNVIYSGKK